MNTQRPSASRSGDINAINQALQLIDRGSFLQASTMCNQLLKKHPKVPAIWGVLSAAQVGMARHSEARRSAQKGLKLNPKSIEIRIRLGLTYFAEHRFNEATKEFERALEMKPGHQWALRCLADSLTRLDRDDEAYELLRPHVVGQAPDSGFGLAYIKVCLKTKRYEEGLEIAGPLVGADDMIPRYRTVMLFKVAELYTKTEQHDRAFEMYRMANACFAQQFDSKRHSEGIDRIIEAWTPEAIAQLQSPSRKSDRFVFIVGMPRSGTSLVEQIAASHPRVYGAGELELINNISSQISGSQDGWSYLHLLDRLTPGTLDQAARKYNQELRNMAPGADLITDKMPQNQTHLGLISAMLPQSKIVHCVRDPRDTCLSCYFHHFLGKGNAYTYGLEDLGSYFADYWRLMKHWKSVLEIPILDVVYEDVIEDQEGQSRRLIDFLGLDWDDRCLEFHKTKRTTKTISADQVNKPIYTSSVARWKPYEKHLGPLIERLPAESLR